MKVGTKPTNNKNTKRAGIVLPSKTTTIILAPQKHKRLFFLLLLQDVPSTVTSGGSSCDGAMDFIATQMRAG